MYNKENHTTESKEKNKPITAHDGNVFVPTNVASTVLP